MTYILRQKNLHILKIVLLKIRAIVYISSKNLKIITHITIISPSLAYISFILSFICIGANSFILSPIVGFSTTCPKYTLVPLIGSLRLLL